MKSSRNLGFKGLTKNLTKWLMGSNPSGLPCVDRNFIRADYDMNFDCQTPSSHHCKQTNTHTTLGSSANDLWHSPNRRHINKYRCLPSSQESPPTMAKAACQKAVAKRRPRKRLCWKKHCSGPPVRRRPTRKNLLQIRSADCAETRRKNLSAALSELRR